MPEVRWFRLSGLEHSALGFGALGLGRGLGFGACRKPLRLKIRIFRPMRLK